MLTKHCITLRSGDLIASCVLGLSEAVIGLSEAVIVLSEAVIGIDRSEKRCSSIRVRVPSQATDSECE
jgi:hypothetical protein